MNTQEIARTLATLFGELVNGAPASGGYVLNADVRAETTHWLHALGNAREVDGIELNGMIGSIAHLAYHLGAIRQINSLLRGPVEGSS